MFYTIYKITNLTNGKVYIGKHQTVDLNDGYMGCNNSQYGTMWITDGSGNKKIKKGDIIPEGWYKGRTMLP